MMQFGDCGFYHVQGNNDSQHLAFSIQAFIERLNISQAAHLRLQNEY